MVRKLEFEKLNQELDTIFGALKNKHKRMVILFIGERGGRVKGGIEEFADPLCEKYKELKLSPYTIAPKLSVLRHTDHLIDRDEEGYWILTDLGKKAYELLERCLRSR